MKVNRPLDLLNASKGKEVLLRLKGGKELAGTLVTFDAHVNLVLDNAKEVEGGEVKRNLSLIFVRGDTILYIAPANSA